ncbi:MAG TPA: hypothetical protein VGY57_02500 [Vicinamibacterales bacterium]|nr:hypothetical protein [Vicinamibacterales bacterium]
MRILHIYARTDRRRLRRGGFPTAGSGTARQTTIAGLNPVAATMYSHPRLVAKLTPMLPKVMTLNQASEGFKSQGRQRRRKRAIDENRGLRD